MVSVVFKCLSGRSVFLESPSSLNELGFQRRIIGSQFGCVHNLAMNRFPLFGTADNGVNTPWKLKHQDVKAQS
jgi:hypothetical protein